MNINAEEKVQITQVCHGKLSLEFLNETLKKSWRGGKIGRETTKHLKDELVLGDWCIDIIQPVGKILQLLAIGCHGGVALDCRAKFMLNLHGSGMFVVVEQVVDDFLESRGSRNRGDDQIGYLIGDGGEDPTLEESVELEPFVVVIGEGDDGAIDVALEVEPPNQKKEESAPLFVIRLGETELNGDMKFHTIDCCECKMRRFGGVILGSDLAIFGHGEGEKMTGEKKKVLPVKRAAEGESRRCQE
ncbi:unnamed protein product [Cuscuta campestris]|uniref:Uncharacterized protein n=1 Tax=Cuscuta campestris TaxID=132261 RepID=A0A484M3Z6_9ASTE|nr:unnamed protein product [Cuscuta campestris]